MSETLKELLWIWQRTDWPHFNWQAGSLAPLLRHCIQAQGRLFGMLGAMDSTAEAQGSLDTLLQNIVLKPASAQPNSRQWRRCPRPPPLAI